MKLCVCPAPLRATAELDRLRCLRCGHWTPHGGLPSTERVTILVREATSLAGQLATDYAWAHSVAFDPARRGGGRNAKGVHADPTGSVAADDRRHAPGHPLEGHPVGRLAVRDYTAVAARLLERAVRALRAADEAIGEALLAAEPPGPVDHTPAPYHDSIPANRPDLADAHAARARRHTRGEGIPT